MLSFLAGAAGLRVAIATWTYEPLRSGGGREKVVPRSLRPEVPEAV